MKLPRLADATPRAIPFADTSALAPQARRTLAVRVALGAALVACLVAALLVSRGSTIDRRTFFSAGKSSVVVIDVSGSIGPGPRGLIGRALRKLVDAHSSFGLVFFSDTAYEAVPLGTRWTEIQPLLRFFGERAGHAGARLAANPWSPLRGGTNISTGLSLALDIVERQHARNVGVLLISDLNNSLFDMPALTRTLARYSADHVPLRVIGLDPAREDEQYFTGVLGPHALVTSAELPPARTTGTRSVASAALETPAGLTALALAVLLLLGANEHWSAGLRWRGTEERR
jgi:von Willebrand factor type A domain